MKHPLAAFTAVGVALALAYRERVDQRVKNLVHGNGFITDEKPTSGDDDDAEGAEGEKPKAKKKGKKS